MERGAGLGEQSAAELSREETPVFLLQREPAPPWLLSRRQDYALSVTLGPAEIASRIVDKIALERARSRGDRLQRLIAEDFLWPVSSLNVASKQTWSGEQSGLSSRAERAARARTMLNEAGKLDDAAWAALRRDGLELSANQPESLSPERIVEILQNATPREVFARVDPIPVDREIGVIGESEHLRAFVESGLRVFRYAAGGGLARVVGRANRHSFSVSVETVQPHSDCPSFPGRALSAPLVLRELVEYSAGCLGRLEWFPESGDRHARLRVEMPLAS